MTMYLIVLLKSSCPCFHHLGDFFLLHHHILYYFSSKRSELTGMQNKHHVTVIVTSIHILTLLMLETRVTCPVAVCDPSRWSRAGFQTCSSCLWLEICCLESVDCTVSVFPSKQARIRQLSLSGEWSLCDHLDRC